MVVFFMPETLKTTRSGYQLQTFKEIELYVVAHLKQCIKMTASFITELCTTK